MPFIEVALGDAKEQEAVPEAKYPLRVVKSEDKQSKGGNQMTAVTLRIEDPNYPNAQLVNHFLVYPNSKTIDSTKDLFLRNINRFLHAFNIPGEATGFNTDDILGATAEVFLEQGPFSEEDATPVNRLRLPPVPKEEALTSKKGKR